MTRNRRALGATLALRAAVLAVEPACAQKYRGVPKLYRLDSLRACRSSRKTTVFAQRLMMPVFNNMVVFDQHVK